MNTPSGIATITAARYPSVTRIREAAMCCTRVPFLRSSASPFATCAGVGKYGVLDFTTAIHQTVTSRATSNAGISGFHLLLTAKVYLRRLVPPDETFVGVGFIGDGVVDDFGVQSQLHQIVQ